MSPALFYVNFDDYMIICNKIMGHGFSQSSLDLKLGLVNVRSKVHPFATSTKRGKTGHEILRNFPDSCG